MSNLVVLLDEYIEEYKEKDKDFNRYGDTVVKELKNDFSQKNFELSFEYIRAKLEEANAKEIDAEHGHRYYKRYYGILMGFAFWLIDKGEYKATDKAEMQANRKMFERLPSWSSPRKRDIWADKRLTPLSIISFEEGTCSRLYNKDYRHESVFVCHDINMFEFEMITDFINWLGTQIDQNDALRNTGFEDMLNTCFGGTVNSYADFTDEFFEKTLDKIMKLSVAERYKGKPSYRTSTALMFIRICLWATEQGKANFKRYSYAVLKYGDLVDFILQGYKPVPFMVYDNPPAEDKVLVDTSGGSMNLNRETDLVTPVDFTRCKDETYRERIKQFIWSKGKFISGYAKKVPALSKFGNFLAEQGSYSEITQANALIYRTKLLNEHTYNRQIWDMNDIVNFVRYMEANKMITIKPIVYEAFGNYCVQTEPNKEAFTVDEMNTLLKAYKKYALDHPKKPAYMLYYYIVKIQSRTPLRTASILDLRTDSLHKELNTKSGEWVLHVPAKTMQGGDERYPITAEVKGIIDEAIRLTDKLRKEAIGPEKNFIFIHKRYTNAGIAVVRDSTLGDHHREMCKLAGIRRLPLGAVRNLRTQLVEDYVDKYHPGDLSASKALNMRTPDATSKYYDKVDIKDFLENYYSVEIGNTPFNGQTALETNLGNKQKTPLGHCQNLKGCDSFIDCLACKHLVLTPSDIPLLEKTLDEIDESILATGIEHERDFRVSMKKLIVKALLKLYELIGEDNANSKLITE